MGTWGATAFEDDTAMEFYDQYCSSAQTLKELESRLDIVLQRQYNMKEFIHEGFMEPVRALVCAEIIAAVNGKPVDTFPNKDYHLATKTPIINMPKLEAQLNNDLKEKAKKTLTKIVEATDIHLTTLWLKSKSFEEWKEYINDLITRLN